MKSLNKVELIGWLGQEPKIITLKNGNLLAFLRLATDIYASKNNGDRKRRTTWHNVKLWRQKQIEYYRNYLTKGSHVLISGHIQYKIYVSKDGQTRVATDIIANYLIDLDR